MDNESAAPAIKAEVQRFKSHKGYTDELRKEFALAFKNCAPTAEIAHALGERLMISCKFYPVPQQVYEAFEAISATLVPEFPGIEHTRDEKSFQEGVFEIWTEADVQRHHALLESPMKGAREYAKAMLKRYEVYKSSRQGIAAEAKA
jgi:hypothetical protein